MEIKKREEFPYKEGIRRLVFGGRPKDDKKMVNVVMGGSKMGLMVKVMVRNGGFEVGQWCSTSRDFG